MVKTGELWLSDWRFSDQPRLSQGLPHGLHRSSDQQVVSDNFKTLPCDDVDESPLGIMSRAVVIGERGEVPSVHPIFGLIKSTTGNLINGHMAVQTRQFSGLKDALEKEIEEIDVSGDPLLVSDIVNSILGEQSAFQLSSKDADEKVELKSGSVIVSFEPDELERGSDDETGIRFMATLKDGDKQIAFRCIAKKEADADEGELEIEDCFVESSSAPADSDEPYSPAMGDLDDVLIEELHKYLGDMGVDSYLAADICDIAEGVENACYLKWLESLKSFVEKQDK